ncbi:hypothetical protein DSM117340_02372 [Lentibacter algarum]
MRELGQLSQERFGTLSFVFSLPEATLIAFRKYA